MGMGPWAQWTRAHRSLCQEVEPEPLAQPPPGKGLMGMLDMLRHAGYSADDSAGSIVVVRGVPTRGVLYPGVMAEGF